MENVQIEYLVWEAAQSLRRGSERFPIGNLSEKVSFEGDWELEIRAGIALAEEKLRELEKFTTPFAFVRKSERVVCLPVRRSMLNGKVMNDVDEIEQYVNVISLSGEKEITFSLSGRLFWRPDEEILRDFFEGYLPSAKEGEMRIINNLRKEVDAFLVRYEKMCAFLDEREKRPLWLR